MTCLTFGWQWPAHPRAKLRAGHPSVQGTCQGKAVGHSSQNQMAAEDREDKHVLPAIPSSNNFSSDPEVSRAVAATGMARPC